MRRLFLDAGFQRENALALVEIPSGSSVDVGASPCHAVFTFRNGVSAILDMRNEGLWF